MYSKEEYDELAARNAVLTAALTEIRTSGHNMDTTCVWMQKVAAFALSGFPHPGPRKEVTEASQQVQAHDGWAWHATTISGPPVLKRLSCQDMVFILGTEAKTGREFKYHHIYADDFETRRQTSEFKHELTRGVIGALKMSAVSRVRAVIATTQYSVIYDSTTDPAPIEE